MKCDPVNKAALASLVIGLLLVTLPPIIANHFNIPDFVRGFSTGLGLTLEVLALVKIQRNRRCMRQEEVSRSDM